LFKDIEGVDVWQKNPTTEPPKGLFAPNPSVLEIHLKKPVPYFLGLLSSGPFSPVPMHVLKRLEHEGKSPEDLIKLPNIVSNGPYMLTHAHFKYEMILEKNPHYWQKQELFFDKIHVYSIGDVYTALHLYEYGNLDWLGPNSSLPVEMSAILARTPDIFQEPQFASQFLWLNIRHPLLRNIKIREALSLAIQRQHLVERIASGSPVAQGGLVPQGIPGYPVAAIPVYDPERARRLLAEAGYPDGKLFPGVLRLLFNHDAGTKMLMEAIAHMWERELGIKTQLVTQEWQTYLHTLDTGDFDIARGGWGGDYLDPTTFLHTVLSRAGGNNVSGWYDARYETLLEKADNLSSPTTRLERLAEAEKLALEAYPLIPLFQRQSITLRKPYLKGLFPHPLQRHPFKWIYLDRKEYISPSSAAY
jgi:ABC-type oligopeptide transport system substrate-binding subunit